MNVCFDRGFEFLQFRVYFVIERVSRLKRKRIIIRLAFLFRLMSDIIKSTDTASPELSEYDRVQNIDLKNPLLAGLMTWLIPGWGQYYQGRTAKAVLFFLCIVPTFVVGCFLGSSSETGIARNVYYSWRNQDKRLHFIPQACLGMAAIPAILQSMEDPPPFGSFMAPAQLYEGDRTGAPPTQATILTRLSFLFELGTYLTMIAGLMNLLAIFDAVDGPLVYRHEDDEDEKEETSV